MGGLGGFFFGGWEGLALEKIYTWYRPSEKAKNCLPCKRTPRTLKKTMENLPLKKVRSVRSVRQDLGSSQHKNLVFLIPKTEDSQFPFVYADGAEVAEVLNAALVHDKAGGEKEREG